MFEADKVIARNSAVAGIEQGSVLLEVESALLLSRVDEGKPLTWI